MNLVYANPAHLRSEAAHWMRAWAWAATRVMKVIFGGARKSRRPAASRQTIAASEVFESPTRRCDEPVFGLLTTRVDDQQAGVGERIIGDRPFGRVIAFNPQPRRPKQQPKPPFGQVIAFDQALRWRSRSRSSG